MCQSSWQLQQVLPLCVVPQARGNAVPSLQQMPGPCQTRKCELVRCGVHLSARQLRAHDQISHRGVSAEGVSDPARVSSLELPNNWTTACCFSSRRRRRRRLSPISV